MPELDAEHRDQMARFAHEHRPITLLPSPLVSGCECGWGNEVYAHSAHVADALAPLVAGWLADAKAEALREAADDSTMPVHAPYLLRDWLNYRADRGGDDG